MIQCSRNGGPHTLNSVIAVGNDQAVLPSNMMMTQNHQTIHYQDNSAVLILLSFPLSTIMLECR